jgi:hypothetical protein
LSIQAKSIIVGILLALARGIAAFCAVATFHAYQELQQQRALVAASDVRAIRPWMTIPYIAHIYHVPESYLYQSLQISDTHPPHHATLHALAIRYNHPVDDLVHTLQRAIQVYREHHPYIHKVYKHKVTICHPLVESTCR